MRLTIAFSGPAGLGVNTSGIILSEILSGFGYDVYADKEYSSVVKGGNNLFVLHISDKGHFISKKIDFYIYFDEFAINKNGAVYQIGEKIRLEKGIARHLNSYAIGLAVKYLGIDTDSAKDAFKSKFRNEILEENLEDLQSGMDSIPSGSYNLGKIGKPKEIFYGNEIIAKGAIDSGLEYYSAYPMTPASSIIDALLHHSKDVVFHQAEDEIAVAMSMLGAKFAGKRAMCGTSGGGFALMSESISYSGMAEIGGVYILSMRAGPSTGTPTFTGQGDLDYALCPTFGDVYPIVLAPSTFEEAYNMIGKALNWSDIYQHPVIVLLDKQFSESYASVDVSGLKPEPVNRGKLLEDPSEDYARYAYQSGSPERISPYTVPGTANGEFIASSYEHDIYGKETEDPKVKYMMEDKRYRKMEIFEETEFDADFHGFDLINPEARKFFITFSSNRWAVGGLLESRKDYGAIIITVLQPIDSRLQDFIDKNADKLVFIEQNQSGQLENLIRSRLRISNKKIEAIRKYDLYPFYEENLGEVI